MVEMSWSAGSIWKSWTRMDVASEREAEEVSECGIFVGVSEARVGVTGLGYYLVGYVTYASEIDKRTQSW